jgi:hypothetical protein
MKIHLEFSNSKLAYRFRQADFDAIELVHTLGHLLTLDGELRKLPPDADVPRKQGHLFTFDATSLQDLVLISPEHHCPPLFEVIRSRRCSWTWKPADFQSLVQDLH